MFTRITESGGRRYLQIVESFRNDAGKSRLRVVANLGRFDALKTGQLDALISGLNRAAGRVENSASEVIYDAALGYGDVFALHELWKDLGFDRALTKALRSGRREIDVEALVRAMDALMDHAEAVEAALARQIRPLVDRDLPSSTAECRFIECWPLAA